MASRNFEIYSLAVGGGTLGLSPLPVKHLDTVTAWAPDLVLCLVEDHEMPIGLWDGFTWCHFPIVDFDTPKRTGWSEIEKRALTILRAGGKVLVHCKGGCGRSGMAALRLMLVAEEPNALSRLRAVRPCAVETKDQLDWATTLTSNS